MAERLTNTLEETPKKGFGLKFCSDRNCNSDEDCCNCYAFNQTINKLRQFEDIMEKYGIESVGELDKKLADGDTWQKACELACETLKQVMGKPLWIGGNIPAPEVKDSEYFYQQAKTEGNDE